MALANPLLTLDLGNSALKAKLWLGQSPQAGFVVPYQNGWQETLKQELAALPRLSQIVGCSVTPKKQAEVSELLPQAAHWVSNDDLTGLGLVIESQGTGIDRLTTAFGAQLSFGGNLVLIDFGTATTYDVILENKHFLGGMILPGLKLGLEALTAQTEGLNMVDLAAPEALIGKNTTQAMQSGIILGNALMADHFVEKISQQENCNFRVFATGGVGKEVSKASTAIEGWLPDLTLQSLARIQGALSPNPKEDEDG